MKPIDYYCGMQIIVTDAITKKVRRRTHKKKRIDKKWLKRYGYKEVQDHSKIYQSGNYLFMSQQTYDKLKLQLAKENEHDGE
jgi:hypothetical protein